MFCNEKHSIIANKEGILICIEYKYLSPTIYIRSFLKFVNLALTILLVCISLVNFIRPHFVLYVSAVILNISAAEVLIEMIRCILLQNKLAFS